MQLTQDQIKAQTELLSFLNSSDKAFVLKGHAGTGKEQPISTYVQTPTGKVMFGNLKVGDKVFTQSGKTTSVVGIYPQGIKPVYEIKFRDGTSTRCGLEHIWWVYPQKTGSKPRQMTTKDLIEKGLTFKSGQYKYRIPLTEPVEFPSKVTEFDPYLIGVLIADGYLAGTTSSFSCTDTDLEIVEEIKKTLHADYSINTSHTSNCKQYRIVDTAKHKANRLKNHLNALGLDVTSKDKFIPNEYMFLETSQRLRLLQGLMDTDGSSRNNRIAYSTVSKQLASDVQYLVQSLGGTAIIHTYDRTSEGKGVEYSVNIKTLFNPFLLERKAANWSLSTKNPPSRYITDITLIGEEEQMCIMVDDPSHLYLTDHFIVTHNTTLIKHVLQTYEDQRELNKIIDPNSARRYWVFTATTHKAVEALAESVQSEVRTIHSLLGLAVRNDYTTGKSFLYKKKDAAPVRDAIIVIDESSYIDDHLLHHIMTCTPDSKIIFMGDPNQLTPVKADTTPVFDQNFIEATLSQVVRQDANNPIQHVCAGFRKTIEESVGFPKITLCNEIQHVDKDTFEQLIKDEFSRPDWKQGDSKVLAWTNKTVQRLNKLLFKHCNNRTGFKAGDYVINNNHVGELKTDGEYQLDYVGKAESVGFKGSIIGILGREYFMPNSFDAHSKAKKKALQSNDVASMKIIMEDWVDLRPAYACTVNKSQGSTYQKVFIDLGDLAKCQDAIQLARLLYVAISRAKYQVIFTGDLKR